MTIEARESRLFGLKKEKPFAVKAGTTFPYRFLTYNRYGEVAVLGDDDIEIKRHNLWEGSTIERRTKEEINKRPRVAIPIGQTSELLFSWKPAQK